MQIGLSEAIALLSSSNNLHYQIWMVYVVVALGLLGFRFSETYDNLSRKRRGIMIMGFVIFSISNLIAMEQNIQHYNVTLSLLKNFDYQGYYIDFQHLFNDLDYKNMEAILIFQIITTCMLSYLLYKPRETKNSIS